MSPLRIERTGPADCRMWADETLLAEVRDLRLTHLRLRKDAPPVIGPEVPLPLFWEQYADHEHPERNASSNAAVTMISDGTDRTESSFARPGDERESTKRVDREGTEGTAGILCRGTNASGSIQSTFRLGFDETESGRYELLVHAHLEVVNQKGWLITPNPHHGELEFCNMWAMGTFSAVAGAKKLYSVTAVRHGDTITLLPHNHLESREKHNIPLQKGDQLAWLLEDENPVITLESELPATAGLCAYMWDFHIAYKVCGGGDSLLLPSGFSSEAMYRLSAMTRAEGQIWLERGRRGESPEDAEWPVYVNGVNTFRHTLASGPGDASSLWPWAFQVLEGLSETIHGGLDQTTGFDDHSCVRIQSSGPASGCWIATTLGPAFGGPAFHRAKRYRLSARVRTGELEGDARIALRLHRSGQPGLHHPESYEQFVSAAAATGTTGWQELQVVSPAIVPEPDRVHLLLLHRGQGTSWFDNVLLEEID